MYCLLPVEIAIICKQLFLLYVVSVRAFKNEHAHEYATYMSLVASLFNLYFIREAYVSIEDLIATDHYTFGLIEKHGKKE